MYSSFKDGIRINKFFRYSVPLPYTDKFRNELKSYLRFLGLEVTDRCRDAVFHGQYLLHPDWFTIRGIPLVRVYQMPGDYVLTFPFGFYFRFDLGFNVNETVNFATRRWIDAGKVAKFCTCRFVIE